MDSKKFMLAMALCFVALIAWRWLGVQIYGPPKEQQTKQVQQPIEEQAKAITPSPTELNEPDGIGIQEIVQGKGYTASIKQTQPLREDIYLGSEQRGSGYKLQVSLSNDGAAIAQAWLTEFVQNSDEYKFSQSPYGEGRKTPVTLLSQVEGRFKPEKARQDQPPCRTSLATSRVRFLKINSQADGPRREELASINLVGQKNWQLLELNEQNSKAVFQTTVLLQQENKTIAELLLRKTYALAKDSYDINVELDLTLAEGSAENLAVELVQDGPTGMGREDPRTDMRAGIYGTLSTAKGVEKVAVTSVTYKNAAKAEGGVAVGPGAQGQLLWAGTMNKFFGAFLVPESKYTAKDDPTATEVGKVFTQVQIVPIVDATTGKNGNVLARLVAPTIELEPGITKSIKMKLFLGPKERGLLKSGEYGRLNFGSSIQYRSCGFFTFGWLSEGLLWLLGKIHAVIPNYGVGIIILVILVRLGLHHFTKTSQVSMMRMSKLAPEIEKLKKKYGNNREELSRAQMGLYKEYKINPLSGCLPMALQMPIWIALYSGLNTAVELRHAPFFWWINNLAGADNITAYFAGGLPAEPITKLPMLGPIWGLNILPILLGVAFFLQQKFMPSAGAAASPQAAQTKKMMYFMMALFPLMLYGAPSGLNLYIMTSTFVGVIENHYIKKHIREKEEAENRPIVGGSVNNIKSLKFKKK
ncbi:MAG: membrane protein insertase YidC [Actinobacteria bacterium]|nr:membrane protein insertase YidC [Actinomycetota bacterium]